jgi:hypothetical protein
VTEKQPDNVQSLPQRTESPFHKSDTLNEVENIETTVKQDIEVIHPTKSRHQIGTLVFETFTWIIIFLTITGCAISFFGEKQNMDSLISFAQIIGTFLTPVVGFVGGYYFGTNTEKTD